jgi:transcriptional regulator with XRE-family HTH domain
MSTTEVLRTRLRSHLKAQGLTYADLAWRMGLSEVTLKRLFSGRTELTVARLDALCGALELDPAELLRRAAVARPAPRAQLTEAQETALARDLGLFRLSPLC